jgi:hypothetical protein
VKVKCLPLPNAHRLIFFSRGKCQLSQIGGSRLQTGRPGGRGTLSARKQLLRAGLLSRLQGE